MFVCKVHKTDSDVLLAVTDKDLAGKKLYHDGVDIYLDANFYGTEICDEMQIIDKIKNATIINAFGSKIVKLLTDMDVVDKNSVILIDKIKHAQVIKV
ncbi:MAG: DUF424 family protein [Candidatus Aenigmarchaeota archaeon]|nr:DUF424 family protein [Candidatus Aenigmarchaeota archaeon]